MSVSDTKGRLGMRYEGERLTSGVTLITKWMEGSQRPLNSGPGSVST